MVGVSISVVPDKQIHKFCQDGRVTEALQSVDQSVQHGMRASVKSYTRLLQECVRGKALAEGKRVHAHIVKSGYGSNLSLAGTLINMYVKCGSLLHARIVFDSMPEHTLFSWTAIISAYANQKQCEEAFNLFQQMQREGLAPDKVVFVIVLKACANLAALDWGKQVHFQIIRRGCESNIFVGSTLINMYAKCGRIDDARQVFNRMPERNAVSWNVMIAGYAQQGHSREALRLFEQMQQEGVKPDKATFVNVLKVCANLGVMEWGKQVHAHIIKSGFGSDVSVGNTLVHMYAKCGNIEDALEVFNKIPERNAVSWTVMIAGYAEQGHGNKALTLFQQMQLEGVKPDTVTFVSVLKACAGLASLKWGKQVHDHIIENGLESNIFVGNALIYMYAKCEHMVDARVVFNKMQKRNVVSWNTLITGYVQQGHAEDALTVFEQMQQQGMEPDRITFISILKACSSLTALELGKQVHSYILKHGFDIDAFVGSTLVDMYAKCGSIEDARQVFDKTHARGLVLWNTMISGYALQGNLEEAFTLFQQMQQEGMKPDSITLISVLKACGSMGTLDWGKQVHAYIMRNNYELDVFVGNTVIDMYAKCGSIKDARQIFNKMSERNVISWTAMIAGYAEHGHAEEALGLFKQMQREGMKPDKVTFLCVLSACCHGGLLEESYCHFISMSQDYNITPDMEHCACMVDLLGRAGCLDEAKDFITKMAFQPNAVVWMALLGACRSKSNVELGRHSFDNVVRLEPQCTGAYLMLSNIYAVAGRWDKVAKVRKAMEAAGLTEPR